MEGFDHQHLTSLCMIGFGLLMISTASHCRVLESDDVPPNAKQAEGSSMQGSLQMNNSYSSSPLKSLKESEPRRNLGYYDGGSSSSSNSIDDCWRGDSNWANDRKRLADCAIGFGSGAVGGKNGEYYVVTDDSDDAVNPRPGTLRYGVIQLTPLWIYFARDMQITLENELIITGDKTLDGRGSRVEISGGPCLTIQDVSNVIVHGLHIRDCKPGRAEEVRSSVDHVGYRIGSDGDGITVLNSKLVWIDHNTIASCTDGLVDVIHGSTAVTISNNAFSDHDKVMLLGHDDNYTPDQGMKVTVCFNRFGTGLVQRMPRCRLGYFHIVNNDYLEWSMYAVGGSANPTIVSEGNRYQASDSVKEVTKRDCNCGPSCWSGWQWTSSKDVFLNGAFFVQSGDEGYGKVSSNSATSSSFLPSMTAAAGALSCSHGQAC